MDIDDPALEQCFTECEPVDIDIDESEPLNPHSLPLLQLLTLAAPQLQSKLKHRPPATIDPVSGFAFFATDFARGPWGVSMPNTNGSPTSRCTSNASPTHEATAAPKMQTPADAFAFL
ncbi:hypothetical protein BDZ91DRAFT_764206 [Kalaharituber pfeilii]|nr:hypothetical protein BDZ91DRAFT_764206 [Kalaharituber pfeilii]